MSNTNKPNETPKSGAGKKGTGTASHTCNGKGADTLSDRDIFRRIIMSQFLPIKEDADQGPLLQSSRDLQYRYRDMCTVSVSTVADVMQELQYTITFVNGFPYWQLYEIE